IVGPLIHILLGGAIAGLFSSARGSRGDTHRKLKGYRGDSHCNVGAPFFLLFSPFFHSQRQGTCSKGRDRYRLVSHKHPLPEYVYDVYMQYWQNVVF
ncbi:MAG: hypothetical protein ACXVI1_12530, partial [Halobacteriota archaeon]